MSNIIYDIKTLKHDHIIKKYDECDIELAKYILNKEQEKIGLKNIRLHEKELRKKVIDRDKTCIISGHDENSCEVAHIKPFCDSNTIEKYDINNCILLDAGLHKLFDKYLWTINPKTKKIIVSDKIKNSKSLINKLSDSKINISDKQLQYFNYHYNIFIEKK